MRIVLCFALALAATLAQAQLRTIPEEAKKGSLSHVQGMLVEIDGKPERLAPGARIRDAENRLVLPAAVAPQTKVRYVRDGEGLVREVWILSPNEAAPR